MRRLLSAIAGLAGLLGAAGVCLAAAAAHLGGGTLADTAALFLMVHAAAALAVVALALRSPKQATLLATAGLLLIGGMILFSGDFSLRAFAGHAFFPMAAPIGALLLIGGWLAAAAAGLLAGATRAGRMPLV